MSVSTHARTPSPCDLVIGLPEWSPCDHVLVLYIIFPSSLPTEQTVATPDTYDYYR